jgi:transcriptional regulator with XRE-family HTH domain
MTRNFGQLLNEKRMRARLSISDLARLSGLPEARLEALEQGFGDFPNFDTCYRLGQIISSHSDQMFVLQDLWQALKADKLGMRPSTGYFAD